MDTDEKQFENFVRDVKFDDIPDPKHRDRLEQNVVGALEEQPRRKKQPFKIWRIIMKNKITKLATAAVIVGAIMLSIHLWDKSTPSAYAFVQTVKAMQGKRSFHIQTYWEQRRKDEYWAEFDEEGKLIRFRQEERKGPRGPIVTLWKDGIRSHYYPPPWNIHLMSRVEKTNEGLEEFDPETIVEELHELVADGKAVMEVKKPAPYARLKTLRVTRTDGKPLTQFVVVDPATKLVVRVDNYWGKEGEQESHKGTEVLEYNESMDPGLFEPDPAEGTITIDQVSQEVGMAQGDMTDEEVGVKVIRECLKAWAVSDYAKAGKLLGGAPPELFARESYRRLQPISVASIGRPVVTEHTMAVLRAKCTYKVKRGGQVETIISKFAVDGVDGQPGRWYVHWLIWSSTEE